jgi:hypothetical protein
MSTTLIEFRPEAEHSLKNVSRLQGKLTMLLGEPFQFARVSYGDELTLHFGNLRPARSPKLKGKLYGEFVLGVRGSPWLLKSPLTSQVIASGMVPVVAGETTGRPLSNEELETGRFIEPSSRVLKAEPFLVTGIGGIGLQLTMTDGSVLVIFPCDQDSCGKDDELPEVADWELLSPLGCLSVGPGLNWSLEPQDSPPTIDGDRPGA